MGERNGEETQFFAINEDGSFSKIQKIMSDITLVNDTMKTDNDILAEYVRENFPNIESSLQFLFYKLCVKAKEVGKMIGESLGEFLSKYYTEEEIDSE